MKERVIVGLVVGMGVLTLCSGLRAESSAGADPFVGSRTLTLYGDSNIRNGFTLSSPTAEYAVSTSDGFHYTVAGGSGSLSMVRSGNQLSLNPRPQGTTVHCYMLADGAVGAFLLMGQEIYTPDSISIRVATWGPGTTVSGAQLAGDWNVTMINDNNLRSDTGQPFETTSGMWSIFDLSDGVVELHLKEHNVTWRMRITGNTLAPLPETLAANPSLAHFNVVTDGNILAMSSIGVETYDNTDVSATIGLGTRLGASAGSSSCQCPVSSGQSPVSDCGELQLAANSDLSNPTHFYILNTSGPFKIIHGIYQPVPTAGDPDYKPILFSGTGQVVDVKVGDESHPVFFMNLHSSQEHADQSPQKYWHDGRIVQVTLDLSTLKATFWSVGTDYNAAAGTLHNGFDKLDVSLVGQLPACLKK